MNFLHLVKFFLILNSMKVFSQNFDNLLDHLKPYQVTIFATQLIKATREQNLFLNKIISRYSTLVLDLTNMENSKDNRSLQTPVLKNPRKPSIYIILANLSGRGSDLNKAYGIFDKLEEISPIPMRPKCLLIFIFLV